mgnify:CR=1 FL=1|jgi:preprotein translocase subunit YajC
MDFAGIALVLAQADPMPVRGQGGGGIGDFLPPIILAFVFVYFFMIRPQKREAKAKEDLLGGLRKNDKVVTTGGIVGTIVNIKDDEVTLRVDDQAKVKIRFLKSAIARPVGAPAPAAAETEKKS